MDVVRIGKKSRHLNAFEKYHIYRMYVMPFGPYGGGRLIISQFLWAFTPYSQSASNHVTGSDSHLPVGRVGKRGGVTRDEG
jgi:hypothetical protein